MEESKRKTFCDDLQGIEENLAALLIETWLRRDLEEFAITLDVLNSLKELQEKTCK